MRLTKRPNPCWFSRIIFFFSVSPLLQVAFLSMFLLPGQPSISNFVLAVGTVRALRQVSQIIFWGDQNGKLIETNIWFTKTCRGQMLSTSCMNPVRRSANPRMHSRNLFSVPRNTHPCYLESRQLVELLGLHNYNLRLHMARIFQNWAHGANQMSCEHTHEIKWERFCALNYCSFLLTQLNILSCYDWS